MTNRSVSVIIPCYNVENYIKNCINSVVGQTQENIEIICVDDGSTDNTCSIIKMFQEKDDRIKLISKRNEGVSVARNIGIKESTGEYLMFLDSDDYIDKNMIKDMYRKAKEKDIDIVKCTRYDVYPKANKKILRKPLWKEETYISKEGFSENIYPEMLRRNRLCSMCMTLCKAEIIKNNNIFFDETLKVDEDAVFTMELFSDAKSFLYIPKPYYFYIKHGNGLSSKGIDLYERFKSRKKHAELIKKYAKTWNINDDSIINEKIAFIGIYTAFQTTRANKGIKFFQRYKIFKDIIKDETFCTSINKSKYTNMLIYEKILCFFVKIHMPFLGYLYGMVANLAIDNFRPVLEKYRN